MPQGELDLGIGTPSPWQPVLKERLFFGVLLDRDTALRVDRFRRSFCDEHHVGGTLRGIKRLHISLYHVGDYRRLPSQIIYAAKLVDQIVSMPPFEVTLHSIKSYPSKPPKHALVLLAESPALVEFHRMLGVTMRRIGLRTEEHFSPHVTLLYGPNAVSQQAIEPIRFVVREFCFIHSMRGLSRYNVIDRWPLIG